MLIKASSSDNGQVKIHFKGIEGTAFRHIQFIINKSKILGDGGHIIQALLTIVTENREIFRVLQDS